MLTSQPSNPSCGAQHPGAPFHTMHPTNTANGTANRWMAPLFAPAVKRVCKQVCVCLCMCGAHSWQHSGRAKCKTLPLWLTRTNAYSELKLVMRRKDVQHFCGQTEAQAESPHCREHPAPAKEMVHVLPLRWVLSTIPSDHGYRRGIRSAGEKGTGE